MPDDSAAPAPATLVSGRSHAFLFDFDGTLVDLRDRPDAVAAPPGLVADLTALRGLAGGALAIVTGRPLAVVDRVLAPLHLAGAGIHGLEMRAREGAATRPFADPACLAPLRERARAFVAAHPGLLLEDKGLSLAVHYRARPELGPEVLFQLEHWRDLRPGTFERQHGKMVAEIRLTGPDKGDATRRLLHEPELAGRPPLFFGDDLTDETAFAAVQALGGTGVFIGGRPGATGARCWLASPSELRRLVARLGRGETVALRPVPRRLPESTPAGNALGPAGLSSP